MTLSTSGTYEVTPADSLIRVINDAAVAVILPSPGSREQTVTVQDASGQSQIVLRGRGVGVTLTNFQKVSVSWDDRKREWFI